MGWKKIKITELNSWPDLVVHNHIGIKFLVDFVINLFDGATFNDSDSTVK